MRVMVVMFHCEAYTAMYLRENRFHHLIFTRKKKCFRTCCFAPVIYDMRIRPEIRKNILRKSNYIFIMFLFSSQTLSVV